VCVCVRAPRCCNTCDDVREAYRRRGWAFKNADTIEQCKREGFSQKMQEQKNEGCQVYGVLEVNKVTRHSAPGRHWSSYMFTTCGRFRKSLLLVFTLLLFGSQVAGNFHFAPGKSFQQSHVHGKAAARPAALCIYIYLLYMYKIYIIYILYKIYIYIQYIYNTYIYIKDIYYTIYII